MSAVSANIIAATATKKITVQGTAGTRHAEYNPIADSYLRANPKAVLTAIIHGVNAHCADMLITMLDIMADKYGHTVNDLIDTVKGDDRWKAVTEHPVLNSLGYFDQEDADRVIGKKSAASTTVEDLHDSVKSAKVAKPTVAEVAAPAEEKPKAKKATTKKAAVETVVETVTHAQAYGIGDADITPSSAAEPAPAKAKKTTKKVVAAAEEAPAPAEEATEVKPKKAPKKAAAVETAVEEATEVKPKKAPKKAAAVDDATVEALADSVAKLTTEEAAPAAAAAVAKKKIVSKKPIAAKPA
jgi:hypothetical protein